MKMYCHYLTRLGRFGFSLTALFEQKLLWLLFGHLSENWATFVSNIWSHFESAQCGIEGECVNNLTSPASTSANMTRRRWPYKSLLNLRRSNFRPKGPTFNHRLFLSLSLHPLSFRHWRHTYALIEQVVGTYLLASKHSRTKTIISL